MAIKRKLLDALAERASFTVPEGMVENEFAQIWQRVEADLKPASWMARMPRGRMRTR